MSHGTFQPAGSFSVWPPCATLPFFACAHEVVFPIYPSAAILSSGGIVDVHGLEMCPYQKSELNIKTGAKPRLHGKPLRLL